MKKKKLKIFLIQEGSMNVKVNKILHLKQVQMRERVRSDETLSIGACFVYKIKNKLNYKPLTNLYLGFKERKSKLVKT